MLNLEFAMRVLILSQYYKPEPIPKSAESHRWEPFKASVRQMFRIKLSESSSVTLTMFARKCGANDMPVEVLFARLFRDDELPAPLQNVNSQV